MKGIVSSVYMETYCHATEDLEKVKLALMNMIPPSIRNSVRISRDVLRGYHGNPIVVLRVRILDKEHALSTVQFLSSLMTDDDRRRIINTLGLRLDRSKNLYIRVDKQYAYRGLARVMEHDDVIKIKISLSLRGKDLNKIREALKTIGLVE